jgi:hypothetical protein
MTPEDFKKLWHDPNLGDGIATGTFHKIAVGKPKNFFRVHPDPAYRRRCDLYVHKPEGSMDEVTYIVGPAMSGLIDEAYPATLVTCIYRDGTPRIWPIRLPDDGGKDFDIIWKGNRYISRPAPIGYAPDPDWSKLPPFEELCHLGVGESGVIGDKEHPIYKDLFGLKPASAPAGDDLDDDI